MDDFAELNEIIKNTPLKHRVFVYGTLMKGECNNYLLEGAVNCGKYVLTDYALYDLGDYPAIIPQTGQQVLGELWLITPAMLPALHELEEEGELYKYTPVTIHQNRNNAIDACSYIYIGDLADAELLEPAVQPWKPKISSKG